MQEKLSKKTFGGYEADIKPDRDESQMNKRKKRRNKSIEEDENLEKKTKQELAEKGRKFRIKIQSIANKTDETDGESTTDMFDESLHATDDFAQDTADFLTNITDYVASNEEEVNEDSDDSEWEHFSDFEFNSDSSGSDWM